MSIITTPQAVSVKHDGTAVRWFFYSAVVWLLVAGLGGLLMALMLYEPLTQRLFPEAIRAPFTFGRLRPMHVNVAIYAWISMVYAGAMLYITPRLCAAPLYSEPLARATAVLWNVQALGMTVSLLLGFTQGREYAELVWPLDLLFLMLWIMLAVNIWGTVARRTEPRVYVSVWSFMAATLIAPLVYAVGNKVWDPAGAYTGMNDAIINFFFVHNIFNVWFTTGAIGLVFYLLPRLTGNPLFSHRLAIWGFSSVWTGQHHLLYGPGPEWLEIMSVAFSLLAAIPNTAFLINFLGTMRGAWHKVRDDVALRFLATGCVFYVLTCVQGIAQSFRGFNLYVHFTNWVIGHSHLALVADYSFFSFALVYALLPAAAGRAMASRRLMEWHYWLALIGLSVFMVDLWIAGLIQAQNWAVGGIPFIETVRSLKPYFFIRLLAGSAVGVGFLVFAWNIWLTARGRGSAVAVPAVAAAR
ncbi:MAG: cbb3-type cytochrome c oxidase subunit I [Chloroflexi bacterium]|nr:cbb3-type cytochrome c oxidase subunit I [Chloroflexota bacterium]